MDSDKDKATNDSPAEGDDGQEPSSENTQDREPSVENHGAANNNQNNRISTPPPLQQPRSTGGKGLGAIALILAAAACIGTIYLWYRFDVQGRHQQEITATNLAGDLKAVSESTRSLEKQLDILSTAQGKQSTNQDALENMFQEKLESSVGALQQQQEALTNSVSKIYESMNRSIDSWALEEVEQLLRMANHSVSLAGDIESGVIGLELADKRLTALGNPELLEVRRLIAEEIGQLKTIKQADLPGLAFRLAGIIATVDKLPLMNEPDRPAVAVSETDDSSAQGNMWMDAGQELLEDLKDLVRIQNVAEPAKPLLPPEQRYFLIGNLRLMLSAAQIAVLRADTSTFAANLEQASQLLGNYFDSEDQSVKSVLADLKDMSGENLTRERPNISGSIEALQNIKSRMASQ